LHNRLPDVPHVQDPDRVEAARIAVEELESELVLMDDGFQHRRLGRDLDLVVIDATCPFGYGHLLPRGLLREPVKGLQRADLALITRVDAADASTVETIREAVRNAAPNLACVCCGHRPSSLLEYPARELPIETLADSRVAVVSAIGNPAAFLHTVTRCGATIVEHRDLPDHDPYAPATVQTLQSWIRSLPEEVERVVCTHKDLVKLRTDRLGGKPLAAVLIDLEVIEGMTPLENVLAEVTSRVQKK
jgi:tetraacyldisaccharide 4'-kinase